VKYLITLKLRGWRLSSSILLVVQFLFCVFWHVLFFYWLFSDPLGIPGLHSRYFFILPPVKEMLVERYFKNNFFCVSNLGRSAEVGQLLLLLIVCQQLGQQTRSWSFQMVR